MSKFFNIAGPCIPEEHYLVPVLQRLPQLSGLLTSQTLVSEGKTLHVVGL